MLPAAAMPALEGIFPMTLMTASADGVPNVANLSRAWAVDDEHLAVADQMLNKSLKNIQTQPLSLLRAIDPADLTHWEFDLAFVRIEREGPLYRRLADDLETIYWMSGEPAPVSLRAALVFRVTSVRKCPKEPDLILPDDWRYHDLLQTLAERCDWNATSIWVPAPEGDAAPRLVATRGLPPTGSGESAPEDMKRVAALVRSRGGMVRLRNARAQLRYLQTVRAEFERQSLDGSPDRWTRELKRSVLGLPLFADERLVAVVCCHAVNEEADALNRYDDGLLERFSRKLGEALVAAQTIAADECRPLFRQTVDRLLLEWDKAKDPFHTVLSARERQVAVCVAQGMTNDDIARALFISKRTVTTHLERIYQKLGVSSRTLLARYLMEKQLLS